MSRVLRQKQCEASETEAIAIRQDHNKHTELPGASVAAYFRLARMNFNLTSYDTVQTETAFTRSGGCPINEHEVGVQRYASMRAKSWLCRLAMLNGKPTKWSLGASQKAITNSTNGGKGQVLMHEGRLVPVET